MQKSRVQKWGNSLALRIPKPFADATGLTANSPVEIRVEDGQLVIRPLARPDLTLDDLLAGITDANLHGEVDSGAPAGGEAW